MKSKGFSVSLRRGPYSFRCGAVPEHLLFIICNVYTARSFLVTRQASLRLLSSAIDATKTHTASDRIKSGVLATLSILCLFRSIVSSILNSLVIDTNIPPSSIMLDHVFDRIKPSHHGRPISIKNSLGIHATLDQRVH